MHREVERLAELDVLELQLDSICVTLLFFLPIKNGTIGFIFNFESLANEWFDSPCQKSAM